MLALTDIIDFLLDLLGDEDAQAQFAQDPQGTLERAGLDGVTAQDIRDARLQLADSGAVCATDDDTRPAHHGGHDAVHEIGYTTAHYSATETVVDQGGTLVTIDDRDTLFFQSISDDDVTVTDNSVAISGSFNEDNSSDSLVAIQDNDTTVSDDDVTIDADGSFNTSDDDIQVAVQDNSTGGGDDPIVVVPADAGDPEPGPDPGPELQDPAEPEPVDTAPDPDDDQPADDPADDAGALAG